MDTSLQALTGANIITFLAVLVALLTLFILFVNAVEAFRKLKKPASARIENIDAQQESCQKKFDRDYRKLCQHNERIDALEQGSRVQCKALHALLEHELHNGNSDEMQRASEEIFNHLNSK